MDRYPSKGGVKLRFDVGSRTLGVEGSVPHETKSAFDDLMEACSEIGDIGTLNDVHYAEIRCTGQAKGSKVPAESLSNLWGHSKTFNILAEAVNSGFPTAQELGHYGVRIGPAEFPNQADWTEVSIAPMPGSGASWYYFDIIYRRMNQDIVKHSLDTVEESLQNIFARIENG
jgi:hypothetical protein